MADRFQSEDVKFMKENWTKEQIEELLGKPELIRSRENQYRYLLGITKNGLPIDEQELIIEFNGNIVQKWYLFR